MTPQVLVLAGPFGESAVPIDGTETTIGCDPTALVSIPDQLMSRRHRAVELLHSDPTYLHRLVKNFQLKDMAVRR